MNVTKKFSGYIRVILSSTVIFFTINGCVIANSDFTSPLGKKINTELDSVSVSLNSTLGWILGGYIEERDGNNLPYISLIPNNGTASKIFLLDEGYASQLFEREGKYYVLLSTGKALKINGLGLSLTEFQFKPNSLIITQEPKLVACTRVGRTKLSSSKIASCYQIDRAWDTDVYWTRMDITPDVCDGNLKVLVGVDKKQNWEVMTLSLETGKELSSKKVIKPELGAAVCQL